MWSNARGCPRVNGGGPLAVLATSVCSGRGGRRLVFQGGSPPTPPATAHSGRLGAGVARGGGVLGWAAGFPRRLLALIRAKGEGAPSGLWWRAWGVCRVGCGVPPQAFCLRVVGEGQSSQGGAPPHTPPRRSTRGPGGCVAARGGCAGWAAGFPRRLLALIRARGEGAPSGLWCSPGKSSAGVEGACAARRSPALRVGAWGRSPHIKKVRGRVGGPRAAQRARPGWGRGGRLSPPHARRYPAGPPTGDALRPRRLVVRRAPDPLTPSLSRKGRGGRRGLGACGAAADPSGGVGAASLRTRGNLAGPPAGGSASRDRPWGWAAARAGRAGA